MIQIRLRKPSDARSAERPDQLEDDGARQRSPGHGAALPVCLDPSSTSRTPAMISPMPAAIGQVNGSPKMAAASTAVPAVPSAPQIPYATPIGQTGAKHHRQQYERPGVARDNHDQPCRMVLRGTQRQRGRHLNDDRRAQQGPFPHGLQANRRPAPPSASAPRARSGGVRHRRRSRGPSAASRYR